MLSAMFAPPLFSRSSSFPMSGGLLPGVPRFSRAAETCGDLLGKCLHRLGGSPARLVERDRLALNDRFLEISGDRNRGRKDRRTVEGAEELLEALVHGEPAAGQEIDVRNLGRPEDLVGDRLLLINGRDRLGRVEVAGHRGPQEALRQARLGVVVDQKHAPAGLCQRACKVIADRGFANPAFLVQGRDDGHAIPSLGCWITPQVSAGLYPVYKPFREIPYYPDLKRVYPTGRERPSWVIHRVYGDRDEKKPPRRERSDPPAADRSASGMNGATSSERTPGVALIEPRPAPGGAARGQRPARRAERPSSKRAMHPTPLSARCLECRETDHAVVDERSR